jgi:hypothetical protein
MAQGLKNLQTSARSCIRRERMLDPNSTNPSQPHSMSQSPYNNSTSYLPHSDDSGYADELEGEAYDGASDRSSTGYQPGEYQQAGQAEYREGYGNGYGHQHSLSNASGSSMGSMMGSGAVMSDPRNAYAVNGRVPSMDMGIDAIINRPSGSRQ